MKSGLLSYYTDNLVGIIKVKQINPMAPIGTVNNITPLTKNKKLRDILTLQVESLDLSAINYSLNNGKKIMPFTYNYFKKNGFKGDFYVHKNGGGSSNADFTTNYSLIPIRERNSYDILHESAESLADILNAQGYQSFFAHANRGSYFNRIKASQEMNFDAFFESQSFSKKARGWGSIDELFIEETIALTLKARTVEKNIYLHAITIQSHADFKIHSEKAREYISKYAPETSGIVFDYLCVMVDIDNAIKRFVELSKQFNDPIIVIFSDHTSGVLDKRIGITEKIPFCVGNTARSLEATRGSILDIAPTICDELGINASQKWIGDSLFPSGERDVLQINGKIITSSGLKKPSSRQLQILDYSSSFQK